MYACLAVFLAYCIDRVVGDPPRMPHPIIYIGRYIAWLEKILQRPDKTPRKQFWLGTFLAVVVVVSAFAATYLLLWLLSLIHPVLAFIVEIWLISTTLASKGLAQAAEDVLKPLRDGNLPLAQQMVGRIVGRDTDCMDQQNVVRATVETVAENIVDGVVSPLFYALIGGAPLAMAYKAVNTLDSMVGYRDQKYLYFGRFSARLDDVANFIPARITGVALLFAAWLTGRNARRALSTMRRDAPKHPSPNSGIPESAVAGCLGIRLGGLNVYKGVESFREYMGDPLYPLQTVHVRATVDLMYYASFIVLLAGVFIHYLCYIIW